MLRVSRLHSGSEEINGERMDEEEVLQKGMKR